MKSSGTAEMIQVCLWHRGYTCIDCRPKIFGQRSGCFCCVEVGRNALLLGSGLPEAEQDYVKHRIHHTEAK